jgi:hypothetical protein
MVAAARTATVRITPKESVDLDFTTRLVAQYYRSPGVLGEKSRLRSPCDAFDSQPMPEQFEIPDAPKTARQVGCFTSFKKDSTMLDVVRKCGVPDKHAGSGIYIFAYYMNDCSTVTVGTPDLKRLGIRHVKQKKTTVLFNNWRKSAP